ncbi:MAG: hypothetical protein ACI9O4_000892 [Chitinophagales bacterium]|jgi:hypothetical protein
MKKIVLALALLAFNLSFAQTTSTFEDFNLGVDSALNGSDLQGGFQNGNTFFPNTFDSLFNSWFGFGISSMTDNTTPGFMNDLSCIKAEGAMGSSTYGVAYMSYLTNNVVMNLTGAAEGGGIEGMYVNNSTYAYLSMRDGDAIAKKFGGITGNDPDFFLLTIEKYNNGVLGTQKVEFYLADFRSANNADDYLISEWTYLDLSSLGNADSLAFSLSSSDVGQFGMNTPSYFCLDDLTTKDSPVTGIRTNEELIDVQIYPNPTTDKVYIENNRNFEGTISLNDVSGRVIVLSDLEMADFIDFSTLSEGIYYLTIELKDGRSQNFPILKK